MTVSSAWRRRCPSLGLLVLLTASPALAQARPAAPADTGQAARARASSSLMAVRDDRGLVTVIAEQASVREVFRVLSRWYDFPSLDIEAMPDLRVPVRFERVPVTQVVQALLRVAGLASASVTPRPRAAAAVRATAPLILVHDGHGLVTVMGEQASTREVLSILSRWFGFPVVNPEAVPDTRGTMRFEGVQVAKLVDRLLRGASLNYVILTNPQTSVPSKVVAARLSPAQPGTQVRAPLAPGGAGPTTITMPGSGAIAYPPANGTPMPMPMPVPVPIDPAMPMLPIEPMPGTQMPTGPGSPPASPPHQGVQPNAPGAPGAAKPGVMTPAAPAKPPG
jgi:hypothetical protein